ncbi:helix-turn-helix transcriptional regulator [Patulibacter defluvii]|uniref:helix-turn-helix transcriptional regulator n=1 Tax=Patulibacter defluvii TaxID=3095358 RepID=UPI002A74D01F|nr:LuxR C-terminal-related transcriptional regulator [Patulibacter sp. DM4]
MASHEAVLGLVELTQELASATSVADLERVYLERPAAVAALPMRGVYLFDPRTRAVERYAATNVSDVFLARYERVGRDEDPNIAWLTQQRRVAYSLDGRSPGDWMASRVYREVFSIHHMVHAVQAPVVVDGELVGTLAFGSAESRPTLTGAELQLIEYTASAFSLALAGVRRDERLSHRHDQALAALELTATAIVLIDDPGDEVRCNPAAERLLDRTVEGRDLVYALTARTSPGERAFVREVPVRWRDGGEGTIRASSRTSEREGGGTVTVLSSAGAAPRLTAPTWAALTVRERQVAQLVATGRTDAEIAGELSLSVYTVKQYLKAIYRKVGVRSRVELTRMVLTDGHPAGP